jgi:iron complex outermembrane receptor protein
MSHWSSEYVLTKSAKVIGAFCCAGRGLSTKTRDKRNIPKQCVWLMAISILISSAHVNADSTLHFNIPRQNADVALLQFGTQADISVVYDHNLIKNLLTNQLHGEFTLEQGIRILLKDSGLKAEFKSSSHLVVTRNYWGIDQMNSKKNLLASTIAFFMGSGAAVVSAADQNQVEELNQRGMEEIIVTAQKREQRLIDVPISISVIDEQVLKNASIKSISDLSYLVPNLSVVESSSGAPVYTIRGVGNGGGNRNSALVGVYLDNIPLSFGAAFSVDLQSIDIARVEVLKGPQGTLYGAGSVGGTIRYVSNKPSFDGVEGSIGLSFSDTAGGDTSNEVTGVVNLPVIDDVLAFRVAATYKDRGGWIDKINDPGGEENFNGNELSHIRLRGLWQVSDDFTADLALIQHRNDAGGQFITNIGDVRDSNYKVTERNGLPLGDTGFSNDYDLYNLTLNYDFGWAKLVSSSAQVEGENTNGADSQDLSAFTGIPGFGNFASEITTEKSAFSQELRLVGSHSQLHWVVGAFYTDIETTSQISAGTGSYLNGDAFPGESFLGSATNNRGTSESYALFGDIAYDITEQLTLALGTRYFEDKQSQFNVSGGVTTDDKTGKFDKQSSRVSLSYALSENATLYASASQGFRSGGFNEGVGVPDYGPEEVNAFELGAKGSLLDGRLNAEAALFFSQYDDYIMTLIDPLDLLRNNSNQNGGGAEIQGVEFSTQFQLTENLSLGLSGNVTETEFVTVTTPTLNVGDPINNVPKYSYSANANYRFNWSEAASGFAYLGYNRQGPSTLIARPSVDLESSDLGFLNATLGAQWQDLTLSLSGANLTNERRSTVTPFITSSQRRPRTVSVDLRYAF